MDQNEHKEKELEEFEEYRYEIENRVRNLCWTVSGDYSLNLKLDTISYTKSPYISLYDAVKQGAFSRYFDRDAFGLYLVKKLYLGADEQPLTNLAQMAVDSAVYRKISGERPGVLEIRRKAFSDTLDHDFSRLASMYIGQIKISRDAGGGPGRGAGAVPDAKSHGSAEEPGGYPGGHGYHPGGGRALQLAGGSLF